MKKLATLILISCCVSMVNPAIAQLQLSPPRINYHSLFFKDTARVTMYFAMTGSKIKYTLDGTEPNSESETYTRPIVITQTNTSLAVRSFADGFLPSESLKIQFFKAGLPFQIKGTQPTRPYDSGGLSVLNNSNSNTSAFNAPGWLGFKQDSVHFFLEIAKPTQVHELLIHTLSRPSSWIHLPGEIRFNFYSKKGKLIKSVVQTQKPDTEEAPGVNTIMLTDLPAKAVKRVELILIPRNPISKMYPGAGNQAWIFIDEIRLN